MTVATALRGFHKNMMNPTNNPLADNVATQIGNQINRNFTQNVLPGIRTGFQRAGQYGSSRHGISEGLAAQGAQNAYSEAVAPIYERGLDRAMSSAGMLAGLREDDLNRAFQAAQMGFAGQQNANQLALQATGMMQGDIMDRLNMQQDAITRGLSLMPGVMQSQLGMFDVLNQIGGQRQGLHQAMIDADMSRWNQMQMQPYWQLGQYMPLIQGNLGALTGSQTTSPGRSPLMGALGGASVGAGLAGTLGGLGVTMSNPLTAALVGVPALMGAFG